MKATRRGFLRATGGILPMAVVGVVAAKAGMIQEGGRESDPESELQKSNCFIRATYEATEQPAFDAYLKHLLDFYSAKVLKTVRDDDYGGFILRLRTSHNTRHGVEGCPRPSLQTIFSRQVNEWYFPHHQVKRGNKAFSMDEHGKITSTPWPTT